MLILEYAILKWHPNNKNYYVSLDYIFTKMGDEFVVKISDLTKGITPR